MVDIRRAGRASDPARPSPRLLELIVQIEAVCPGLTIDVAGRTNKAAEADAAGDVCPVEDVVDERRDAHPLAGNVFQPEAQVRRLVPWCNGFKIEDIVRSECLLATGVIIHTRGQIGESDRIGVICIKVE